MEGGPRAGKTPDELAALDKAGVVGFKFFWGYAIDSKTYQLIYNYKEGMENVIPPLDVGEVYKIFREVAKTGKMVAIHAEDFDLIKTLTAEVKASGETDYAAMLRSRAAYLRALSAAEKLPEMDEATAWRTEVLLAGWRYSAKFGRMMQLIRYGDRPECQPELKQLFDEINAFADTEFGKLVFENRIIKGVCGGVADAVKVNLAAIPKGDSYYSDRFLYGGTLKFYADFENTQFDLWGVQAQPGREGRITLPLKTADGVFKKVMLDFYLTSPGMRLWGVDAAGQQQLIRDFSASGPTGPVEVPEALLGREMLTLVWTLDNASETACGMLFYGSVSCSVE